MSATELKICRIAQVCDPQLGFGSGGFSKDLERFKRACGLLKTINPNLTVITGDMLHENNTEQLQELLEVIKQYSLPLLLVPGNHDLSEPVTRESLATYRKFFGHDRGSTVVMGIRVIGLNSQLWFNETPHALLAEQEQWLDTELETACRLRQPAILVSHSPPFMNYPGEESIYAIAQPFRSWLLTRCRKYKIPFYLAGHSHTTCCRKYMDTLILNGETLTNNFDGHPLGFRLLEINVTDLSFTWKLISVPP